MATEVLIYGGINDSSAKEFIQEVSAIEDEGLTVRLNTGGGSPEASWGMIAKFNEFEGEKNLKIDGKAYSMGSFFAAYTDNVEALDTSKFLIHRASFGFFEEFMSESDEELLNTINKSLRTALEAKIDVPKFERMKKTTMDELFSMEGQKDVILTASEAKKIGLISSIVKITPAKRRQLNKAAAKVAAFRGEEVYMIPDPEAKQTSNTNSASPKPNIKTNNMTFDEIKSKHPEVFAQIKKEGIAEERDRGGAWAVFAEVDPKVVAEGIKSGKNISQTAIAEFSMKSLNATVKANLAAENTVDLDTDKTKDGGKKLSELEVLQANMKTSLQIEGHLKTEAK